jgi:phage terminase large subunit-like protein
MPASDKQLWRANPPRGTSVCGGFDGSENDDITAIKLETRSGLIFTPRYGPDGRPTIWDPREWGGQIPHDQVDTAWDEICTTYDVLRVYCDPGFRDELSWESDIERWATKYPDAKGQPTRFISWQMSGSARVTPVYAALRRFEADLAGGLITHDGCPITATHMANARKIAKPSERYALMKPHQHQKIDVAVTSVLAHEAASDMRAEGWPEKRPTRVYTARSTRRR